MSPFVVWAHGRSIAITVLRCIAISCDFVVGGYSACIRWMRSSPSTGRYGGVERGQLVQVIEGDGLRGNHLGDRDGRGPPPTTAPA